MRITIKSHIQILFSHFVSVGIGIVVLFCYEFSEIAIRTVCAIYFVLSVPVLYIHYTYYRANKNMLVQVDPNKIIINKNGVEIIYRKENIKSILVTKSASKDKGGFPMISIESYFNVRVAIDDGSFFYLTNLLHPKIDEKLLILVGVPIYREKKLFCFI